MWGSRAGLRREARDLSQNLVVHRVSRIETRDLEFWKNIVFWEVWLQIRELDGVDCGVVGVVWILGLVSGFVFEGHGGHSGQGFLDTHRD
jgi:hypothetical protein